MNEYTAVIFAASAMICIAGLAFYSSKQEPVARLALGIILVCAVIDPLVSMVRGLIDIDYSENEAIGQTVYEKTAEEAFLDGVRLAIMQEFSISAQELSVSAVGFSSQSMNCERITVTLMGSACFADVGAIRAFVEENNLGKCEVKLGFG